MPSVSEEMRRVTKEIRYVCETMETDIEEIRSGGKAMPRCINAKLSDNKAKSSYTKEIQSGGKEIDSDTETMTTDSKAMSCSSKQ